MTTLTATPSSHRPTWAVRPDRTRRLVRLALALVAAFAHAAARPAATSPGAQLARALAEADEADLRLVPQNALARGDTRFAGRFGDGISDAWVRRAQASARRQWQDLQRIPRQALSPAERIAYDTQRFQVELALDGFANGAQRLQQHLPLDPVFGAHLGFAQLSSGQGQARFQTVRDYDNGLQRLAGYARFLDEARRQMRRGMATGQVHTRAVTEALVRQFDAILAQAPDDSDFMLPLRAFPSGVPAAEQRRLTRAYRQELQRQVWPASRRLRDFLAGDYLAASRSGPPGWGALPNGAQAYAHALRLHTTTRWTAQEIHELGLREVARIQGEMAGVLQSVGFTGTLPAFFAHLQADPGQQFDSPQALLDAYARIGAAVSRALPDLFGRLPRGGLEIRPVPAAQQATSSAAFYLVGTPDGQRPGVFHVNTGNLPSRTRPRMTALYLHEALPGHHLQAALAQEDASLPALLRFGWNAGYGEGWALYAESLGEAMGLYADPYQRFGRLDMEMIRAARMVVDTGLHAMQWSREQAVRYLTDHSSLSRADAETEIDRYTVWPGQACAYKVGELAIRRLRARAEVALGERFDLRDFHDQVLNTGAIGLAVLEDKIEAWLQAQGATAPATR